MGLSNFTADHLGRQTVLEASLQVTLAVIVKILYLWVILKNRQAVCMVYLWLSISDCVSSPPPPAPYFCSSLKFFTPPAGGKMTNGVDTHSAYVTIARATKPNITLI